MRKSQIITQIFYYCHMLFIAYYLLLVIHAPNFWKWLLAPGIIYAIEVMMRVKNSFGSHGYTYIQQGTVLPSRVIHLVIKRPPSFDFRPGDWVLVQIPEITTAEWHPFTISSAPEMSDVVWLHIRAVGHWTNRLLEYFLEQENRMRRRNRMLCLQGQKYDPTMVNDRCEYVSASDLHNSNSSIAMTTLESGTRLERLFGYHNSTKIDLNNDASLYDDVVHDDEHHPLPSRTAIQRQDSSPLPPTRPEVVVRPKRFTSVKERGPKIRRNGSKIYILPRPNDCDDFACRRRPVFNTSDVERGQEFEAMQYRAKAAGEISSLLSLKSKDYLKVDATKSATMMRGTVIKLDRPLHIHMDGPYGSPTTHIFSTQHAVLIATGIGVTPFASILQSIMFRYIKAKHVCPACDHSWSDSEPPLMMRLKKVDFVWINRDQKAFEWFVNLLSELEITQAQLREAERFLDIHMYVTSARSQADLRPLNQALDLMHDNEKREMITGLKTRTVAGRPDWDEVSVARLDRNHENADTASLSSLVGFRRKTKVE